MGGGAAWGWKGIGLGWEGRGWAGAGEAGGTETRVGSAPAGPGGAAADAPPGATPVREVTGWDGSFEEAVSLSLVDHSRCLRWGEWLRWRKFYGARPTLDVDPPGSIPGNKFEAQVWRRIMTAYYG